MLGPTTTFVGVGNLGAVSRCVLESAAATLHPRSSRVGPDHQRYCDCVTHVLEPSSRGVAVAIAPCWNRPVVDATTSTSMCWNWHRDMLRPRSVDVVMGAGRRRRMERHAATGATDRRELASSGCYERDVWDVLSERHGAANSRGGGATSPRGGIEGLWMG